MRLAPYVILLMLIGSVLVGCTTITRGSQDALLIETVPSNAQVRLSNGMSCSSTPCALRMPRRSDVVLNITRKGCEPSIVNVTHRTANAGAAGMAGNVLVGGLVGIAVDASTGASQELIPNPVKVELSCKK